MTQQAVTPNELLRRLSTRLAKERSQRAHNNQRASLIVLGYGVTLITTFLTQSLLPGILAGAFLLLMGVLVDLRVKHEGQLSNTLLLLIKDQHTSLRCDDLIFLARHLPSDTPSPLPELLQARLAERLPYASAEELIQLPSGDLAWLRAQLTHPNLPEPLGVAILLALSLVPSAENHALAQHLAVHGTTERLREAAQDALRG